MFTASTLLSIRQDFLSRISNKILLFDKFFAPNGTNCEVLQKNWLVYENTAP